MARIEHDLEMRLAGWRTPAALEERVAERELAVWMDAPSGYGLGYFLLDTCGDRLLLVHPQRGIAGSKEQAIALTLGNRNGAWSTNGDALVNLALEAKDKWREYIAERYQQMLEIADAEGGDARIKAERAAATWRRGMLRYLDDSSSTPLQHAQRLMPGIRQAMLIAGKDTQTLECYVNDLDADTRYLGFDDCIYDLREHRALSLAEGKAALVTRSVGYRLADLPASPEDVHPDAKALLAHPLLDAGLMRFVRQSLAYALTGKPAKQFHLLTDDTTTGTGGGGNSGKTTLMESVIASIGEYGGTLESDALRGVKEGSAGRPTPELEVMGKGRIAFCDEADNAPLNASRMKRLSGGGMITFRLPFGQTQRCPTTAAMFGASNDLLRMSLAGDAELERYCPIPLPQIPADQRIARFVDRFAVNDPATVPARAGVLAMLLRELAMLDGAEPVVPDAVTELAREHQKQEQGSAGEWVSDHIIQTGVDGDRVSSADLWQAYTQMVGNRAERWMTQAKLAQAVTAQHKIAPKVMRIGGGKAKRGFAGVKLTDDAQNAILQAGGGARSPVARRAGRPTRGRARRPPTRRGRSGERRSAGEC